MKVKSVKLSTIRKTGSLSAKDNIKYQQEQDIKSCPFKAYGGFEQENCDTQLTCEDCVRDVRFVKYVKLDSWNRKVYRNLITGAYYKDVENLYSHGEKVNPAIEGKLYTVTGKRIEGEPDCPLRSDLKFILVGGE